MTLTGMNIGEIRSLASQLQRRSDAVADSARVVDRLVQLTRRNWYGDDIAQFESRWNGGTRAIAERVATELRELAETARRNADDQERTSNELGGGNSGGAGTGGGGDQNPFSWVGDGLDWLGDRVEDGLDWAQDAGDWVADRASDAWDWTTDRVDDAWNWTLDRVDDVANFVVPRVEAGLAGWDRFVEALGANAQAWNFFDGHPPQLSEVLAAGVLALGDRDRNGRERRHRSGPPDLRSGHSRRRAGPRHHRRPGDPAGHRLHQPDGGDHVLVRAQRRPRR